MTRISPSRGIMYSAPPAEEDRDETGRSEDARGREGEAPTGESPESESALDPASVSSMSDANWSGNVPADD